MEGFEKLPCDLSCKFGGAAVEQMGARWRVSDVMCSGERRSRL